MSSSFSARTDTKHSPSFPPERASVNSCIGCNARFTDSSTYRSCQEGTRGLVFRSAGRTSHMSHRRSKTLSIIFWVRVRVIKTPPDSAFWDEWVFWEVVLLLCFFQCHVLLPAVGEMSTNILQSPAARAMRLSSLTIFYVKKKKNMIQIYQ